MESQTTRLVRAQGVLVIERHEPRRIAKRVPFYRRVRTIFSRGGER